MTRLSQLVAVEPSIKGNSERAFADAYKIIQKDPLFHGITKTYNPNDDQGEKLPGEHTKVQQNVELILADVASALSKLFDLRYTKDIANREASADLVVDGVTFAENVPVTFLLTLETKLVELRAFVKTLPILDPAEYWQHDSASGAYRSRDLKAARSKKVPRSFVKSEATDKFPAQVELYMEDVIVGEWTTVKFSGRAAQDRQTALLERLDNLIKSIRYAREIANNREIEDHEIGARLFEYILRG